MSLVLRIAGALGLYSPEESGGRSSLVTAITPRALLGDPTVAVRPRRGPDQFLPNDVPRNNLGWPTIEPAYFTLQQLLDEAEDWRPTAVSAPGCVGDGEFRKYADELVRQGYLDETDLRTWRLNGPPRFVYRAPNPDFPDQKKWLPEFPANRDRTQRRDW